MENCPYCNEFMEIASDTPDCTHISIDPQGEWCCLNCNAHFDLDLQEVPIDEGINKKPSTPTNPTPPAQNPSQTPTQNPSDKESSQESNTESSKGDSKEDSKENPSQPQSPQNLTLSTKEQIALAEQVNGHFVVIEEAFEAQDKLRFFDMWKGKGKINKEVLLAHSQRPKHEPKPKS